MRNTRQAPSVAWELEVDDFRKRTRRSALSRASELLDEAAELSAMSDDVEAECSSFGGPWTPTHGLLCRVYRGYADMAQDKIEHAAAIKAAAARRVGRRKGLDFPRLWEFFGKDALAIEDVIYILRDAGIPMSKDKDADDCGVDRFYLPYAGVWTITIDALRRFWFSVGCDPYRAVELAPVWAATAKAVSGSHSFSGGIHWSDALYCVARDIRARSAGDWVKQARGYSRTMGHVHSSRWLRHMGSVSPEMAAAIWANLYVQSVSDYGDILFNLNMPKWSDMDFWGRVEKLWRATRHIGHAPGRGKAVRMGREWTKAGFTRIPRDPALVNAGAPVAPRLFQYWKQVQPFATTLVNAGRVDEHTLLACLQAVEVYGQRALGWLGDDPVEWHDRGIELYKLEPAAAEWLYARRGEAKDIVRRASKVAAAAEILRSKFGKELSELDLRSAEDLLNSLVYDRVRDADFAIEAASHKVSQSAFEVYQQRWMNRVVEYESIPWVDVEVDGYRFVRLHRDDPRALFAGEHTDCCQHPDGAAKSSAWHSVESPDGAVYVVERYGKIVAQSWAWRRPGSHILVLDNIELLANRYEKGAWPAYVAGCDAILGNLGITQIHVGTGCNDMDGVKKLRKVNPVPAPSGCYTDARRQRLICEK